MEYEYLNNICQLKQWKTIPNKDLINLGYTVYGANGVIGYYSEYNHKDETIMLGCRGTCGSVHISKPFSYINGNVLCLDNLSNKYLKKYVYYFLKSIDYSKVITGTGIPQITQISLKNILIPKIIIENQRTIVEELEKIEHLIQKNNNLFESLETIVKSQFIEMFDTLNYPIKQIEDVCILKSGTTFDKSLELENGDLLYCKVSDMNLEGNEKYMIKSKTYVSKEVGLKCCIPANSTIFPKRGGAIGTNKKRILLTDTCVDLNTMGVTPLECINSEYLYQYFQNLDLGSLCDGSTIPQLNNKNIGPLLIKVPPIKLQNRFASFAQQIDKSKYFGGVSYGLC